MPNYIVRLDKGDKEWYLEWSTVVDAPVTCGMSLEDFVRYYEGRYGASSASNLPARLERVAEKGTSAHNYNNVDKLISFNRAGKDEACLTKDELIYKYCEHPETDDESS